MAAATPQFADITTVPTQAQVLANEVLPQLAAQPGALQVTSWPLGGVYRSLAMVIAFIRTNARLMIAALAAAGFEDYVFGRTPAPGGLDVTGWAPLVAKQRYGIVQKPATFTRRTFTLTNASASTYFNIQSGAIIGSFLSGNRYVLQNSQTTLAAAMLVGDTSASVASTVGFPTTGTLQIDLEQVSYTGVTPTSFTGLSRGANGTLAAAHLAGASATQLLTLPAASGGVPSTTQATFRSEFLNQIGSTYNSDASGVAIGLVTSSFAGLTVTNPAPTFSPVAQAGSGIGLVTPSGTPSGSHTVSVQITGSGIASTAAWSTSLDGAAYVPQSGASVSNLGGFGINITLTDNGGNPSFIVGTYYYFNTPGSDIITPGNAVETPQALGQRVAGLWPLLGFVTDAFGNFVPPASPTQPAYVALALSANANVAIAFVAGDPNVNNLVHLYVAGQGGASLPPTVVASEQVFFQTFSMVSDTVQVSTPTTRAITLAISGAITVKRPQLALAQQTMQARLQSYFGGTDPAQALGINGRLDFDYVLSLIRSVPGISQITGSLTINGASTDLQLPVTPGAFEVATWAQQVATAFTWSPV